MGNKDTNEIVLSLFLRDEERRISDIMLSYRYFPLPPQLNSKQNNKIKNTFDIQDSQITIFFCQVKV